MADSLTELKRRAIKAGMDMAVARKADRDALQNFIQSKSPDEDGKEVRKVAVKKKVVKHKVEDAPVKKRGRPPGSKNKPKVEETPAPKRRGRPPGSKNKPKVEAPLKKRGRPPGSKNKPKVEKAARKRAPKNGKIVNGDAGRAMIERIDYSVEHENWNPRPDSPVAAIWKSLKRHRDDVEKVFNDLLPNLWDFVGKEKRDGSKRTRAEAEAVLKYRINRTRFEYAVRTGQHKVATNRVKYGEGQYATGKPKRTVERTKKQTPTRKAAPVKKAGRPAKAAPRKATKFQGWQPGSRGRIPATATKAQRKEHERIRKERLALR